MLETHCCRLLTFLMAMGLCRTATATPEGTAATAPAGSVERYFSTLALGIQKTRLENGLEVVLNVERGTPLVAVSITFPVGRDHGAAFLEWLDSVRHWWAPDDTSDHELVRARGAVSYRSGGWEHVTFTQVLPPDELPLALWLEGWRLRPLILTSAPTIVPEFLPSFPFVEPERRALFSLEQLAWASGTELAMNQLYLWRQTPYGAVVTITGDFDSDEALRLLADRVGSWAVDPREPEKPRAERTPDEVERLEGIDFDRVAVSSPLPELSLGFVVAGAEDASFAAVTLAAELLERTGSWFGSQVKQTSVELSEARGRSLLALHLSQRSPGPGVRRNGPLLPKVVFDALRRLASRPLAAPTLEALRKSALLRWLEQFASSKQRSELLGRYEVLHGEARLSARHAEHLASVTASDLQRVLARLTADQAVVLAPPGEAP